MSYFKLKARVRAYRWMGQQSDCLDARRKGDHCWYLPAADQSYALRLGDMIVEDEERKYVVLSADEFASRYEQA